MYMITVQDDKPTNADKHSGAEVAQRKTAEFRSVKVGKSKGFLQEMVLKLILQASLGISHITNGEIIIDDKKYVQMQERRSHWYMSRCSIVRSNSFFLIFLFLMVYLSPLFHPYFIHISSYFIHSTNSTKSNKYCLQKRNLITVLLQTEPCPPKFIC